MVSVAKLSLTPGTGSERTGASLGSGSTPAAGSTAAGGSSEIPCSSAPFSTISASTFGSHACFYSDATVLTAKATGCTPLQHAITQFPYALIAAGAAASLLIGVVFLMNAA